MARRRNNTFGDLMTIASKLTWKVCVALAFISFAVMHIVAQLTSQIPRTSNLQALGAVVLQQYLNIFATLLQYVLPLIFLISALASFIKRERTKNLIRSVRDPAGREASSLSWQEFERLIAEGFRQRGFEVTERGGAGPDGGVDLALARGRERFLVQCKQWRAQQVGVSVVRELYGVMAAEHVAGGYVVTSGTFTTDAKDFATGRNIELIDAEGLAELLRAVQPTPRSIERAATTPAGTPQAPSCPKCRSPMVLRTAKAGSYAGRSFWGCQQYPKCRAIVSRE